MLLEIISESNNELNVCLQPSSICVTKLQMQTLSCINAASSLSLTPLTIKRRPNNCLPLWLYINGHIIIVYSSSLYIKSNMDARKITCPNKPLLL